MAWFRWHEETTTDPKLRFIAQKCRQPGCAVIALWAMILERASKADERGDASGFDCESADTLLDIPAGASQTIYDAMVDKGLLTADGLVVNWTKRQPKREESDSGRTSTQRSRECRERQKNATQCNAVQHDATQCNAVQHDATQCNAMQRKNPLDKIRVEENIKDNEDSSSLSNLPSANPPSDPAVSSHSESLFLEGQERDPASPQSKATIPKPRNAIPACPQQEIVALYHEVLPELPRVKIWKGERPRHLAARWKDRWQAGKYQSVADGLIYWRNYFQYVRQCPFLMGKIEGRSGRTFNCDLEWLIKPANFAKVIEERYRSREREYA